MVGLDLLRPVTEEELRRLSERNPGYQLERTREGRLLVSPTGGESGRRSLEEAYQLKRWNEAVGLGVVFDSSTGFRLPDGSIFAPDAAFVSRARWEALSPEERKGFPPLAPEAVFEVRSPSQDLEALREKMRLYLDNGVLLGVLIDPYARRVEVHRPWGVETHGDPARLALDPELPGLVREPGPIW